MKQIEQGSMRRLGLFIAMLIAVFPIPYYIGKYIPMLFGSYEPVHTAETWGIGIMLMIASVFVFFIVKGIVDFILYNKRD